MREPDRTYEIARDSVAVAWTNVGDAVAQMVQRVTGESLDKAREHVREASGQEPPTLTDDELVMRAWKLTMPESKGTTAVTTWLVNGPFHPFWRWWLVYAFHLRPVAGADDAVLFREDATHEVQIASLNPEHEFTPESIELKGLKGDSFLVPLDLAHQVIGLRDGQAAELVELMVRYIGSGRISPDQDFGTAWAEILDNTAEHLRFGTHPSMN